jgi:hypothetical protein
MPFNFATRKETKIKEKLLFSLKMIREISTSLVVEDSKETVKSIKIYKYNLSLSSTWSHDSVEEFTDFVESTFESSWHSTLRGSRAWEEVLGYIPDVA